MVLCLACWCTGYSNAQDVAVNTTGNLVEMYNWSGVTYTNTAGVSQCCSGGPYPALNVDTNTIRFSWGYMTAAQSIAINKAFESIGTGIKVTGYNYSWQINNADYNSGPLMANVRLVGANGNVLESYNYDYSRYIPNFETFSGTQKFSVDYGVPSLSTLDVSFTGSDNRFWAGYYGPRVRDVNLSLNYSFDTSKPTASITNPTVVTNVDTISNTTESSGLLSSTTGLPQEVINGTAPDVLATPTTTTTPSGSTPVVVAPTVEAVKDTSTSSRTSSSGPSALAMSVVQKNREAVKAIEAQAVQRVQEQIASDAKVTQQQTQLAVDTVQQTTQQSNVFQLAVTTNTGTGFSLIKQSGGYQAQNVLQQQTTQATTTQQSFGVLEQRQEQRQQDAPQIPQQLTNARTDPVKALTEPLFSLDSIPQETKLDAMRADARDSELAGGMSIASIAVLPIGYSTYTNYQLLDAKFYSDKPIYQNQRVIDNVRVLRGLGSDLKHQQMVLDQYK